MNSIQFLGGSGVTVLVLFTIWAYNFWRSDGLSYLWGALTGQYVVA